MTNIFVVFEDIFEYLESKISSYSDIHPSTNISILKGLGQGCLAAILPITFLYFVLSQLDFSEFNFLTASPNILVGSLVTLTGLLATFVALSYNLTNKLPKKISRKYILHSKLIWKYLGIQVSFILISGMVIYLGLYSKIWSVIFTYELFVSGIVTVVFFVKYVQRTDKEGIYQILAENTPENYLAKEISVLEENKYNEFEVHKKPRKYILEDEENSNEAGLPYYRHSNIEGVVKINEEELVSFLEDYSDELVRLEFTRSGVLESKSRGFTDNVLNVSFLREFQVEREDLSPRISDIIEVKEVEWLEDWILCLNHSAEYEQERLEDDFEFLQKQVTEMEADETLFMMILDRLASRFAEEENNSRRMLNHSISLAYAFIPKIKENEWLAHQYLFSLRDLHLHYLISLQEKYDPEYPKVLLNINELGGFFYRERFLDLEGNENQIESFEDLFERHIDVSAKIIQSTAENFFINPDVYSKYLRSLLENYNQLFSNFTAKDLKTEIQENSEEAADRHQRKVKSISWIEDYKNEKGIEIFLFILNEIENAEVDYSVSELVLQFGTKLDFAEWNVSGDYTRFSTMFSRDSILQFTAKYILILQIYRKKNDLEFDMPENSDYMQFGSNLESLELSEVEKWLEINEDEFSEIKLELNEAIA